NARILPMKPALFFALTLGVSGAAPRIEKVEPPNWWTPYSYNPVQVLLTGSDLRGASITTTSRDFKINVRHISDDGRYLFVYLDVARNARPGIHRFSAVPSKSMFWWSSIAEVTRSRSSSMSTTWLSRTGCSSNHFPTVRLESRSRAGSW